MKSGKTEKILCTVDRVEEGQAVCISDADGAVFVLSAKLSSGIPLRERDRVTLTVQDGKPCGVEKSSTPGEKSENGERLRRLFDKFRKE